MHRLQSHLQVQQKHLISLKQILTVRQSAGVFDQAFIDPLILASGLHELPDAAEQ